MFPDKGCNLSTNGFQPTNDYILGPSGEQLTEMQMNSPVSVNKRRQKPNCVGRRGKWLQWTE
jgi:hypothetical protein